MRAGVTDDALVVVVDVHREVAAVVATIPIDEDDDDGFSGDPFSGDDVGSACSVYVSARGNFSVPDKPIYRRPVYMYQLV